jgi:hypothetical protein
LTGINMPNQNYIAWYASGGSGGQNVAIRGNGDALELSSGGGLTMTMDANQRVGIGTSSPVTKTQITTNLGGVTPSTYTDVLTIGVSNGQSETGKANVGGGLVFRGIEYYNQEFALARITAQKTSADWNGFLTFHTNPGNQDGTTVERMRIDPNGAVIMQKYLQLYCSTGSQDGMYIQNLSNNTSANAIIFRGWNASTTGSIATYVNLTTYNTSSDYRLKEDLKEFGGLDMVSKLKMYDFKWKEADWRMYGGLAHEIAEVVPYAVNGEKDAVDEEGNVKSQGVDYSTLVPLLIKAIQELTAKVEALEAK